MGFPPTLFLELCELRLCPCVRISTIWHVSAIRRTQINQKELFFLWFNIISKIVHLTILLLLIIFAALNQLQRHNRLFRRAIVSDDVLNLKYCNFRSTRAQSSTPSPTDAGNTLLGITKHSLSYSCWHRRDKILQIFYFSHWNFCIPSFPYTLHPKQKREREQKKKGQPI